MSLGPGLTRSDSECCSFFPTLLENDPSIPQQVDPYLLHGSDCKTKRLCENISKSWGILVSGKILTLTLILSKEIQRKVHGGLQSLKEMAKNSLFRLPPKLSMTLFQKVNLSFCSLSFQTFLFQQPANMGGKKVSPPQESPTDRPDRRLSEARAYFICRVRLT